MAISAFDPNRTQHCEEEQELLPHLTDGETELPRLTAYL